MDISVTDFKARCLDLIRQLEKGGKPVTIRRHGKIVARLEPAGAAASAQRPWEHLRALGGTASNTASESVLRSGDFEALR